MSSLINPVKESLTMISSPADVMGNTQLHARLAGSSWWIATSPRLVWIDW
jgi:hypothetical protein